jgi:hypothetical protein
LPHAVVRLAILLCCLARAADASAQESSPEPTASPATTAPGTQTDAPTSATRAAGAAATSSHSQDSATSAPATSSQPPTSADVSRRSVPDYDGRGPEPTTAGDVLVWVPRVVLFLPYVVIEYVVAVPLGWLATTAERNQWPQWLYNLFAFGPDHQGGIFPTFLVDFGLRPSIGLHFFWNNTFVQGNRISADAAWGGHQWGTISVGDRYDTPGHNIWSIQAAWNRRPDTPFYGIGSQVLDTFRSRVGSDQVFGSLMYESPPGLLVLQTEARLQRVVFRDYTCCGDPSLQDRVDAGQLPAPPGFNENTTSARFRIRAILDTRHPGRLNQSGVRLAAEVQPVVDVVRGFDRSWLAYAAGIEGAWDVTGKARVLTLGVLASFVDPLGSEPVPFNELVSLGGTEPMTGYLPGRLRDRSALVARLAWHWPVFAFVDGVAAVAFGNVFDAHLSNFSPDLLRLSAEAGFESRGSGSSGFVFVMGIGTETFRDGLRLTSFRLSFGVKYGL